MTSTPDLKLGPLVASLKPDADWPDWYPTAQCWADDLERLLAFIEKQGQWDRFKPRLIRMRQTIHALAEARAALYVSRCGFEVASWDPKGAGGTEGEFTIRLSQAGWDVFVEVKAPDWEGELKDVEKRGKRKRRGKYIDGEGRAVDPVERILFAISKARKKFSDSCSNLLAVVPNVFWPPTSLPDELLRPRIVKKLSDVPALGGILIVEAEANENQIRYNGRFVENPQPLEDSRLPLAVCEALSR